METITGLMGDSSVFNGAEEMDASALDASQLPDAGLFFGGDGATSTPDRPASELKRELLEITRKSVPPMLRARIGGLVGGALHVNDFVTIVTQEAIGPTAGPAVFPSQASGTWDEMTLDAVDKMIGPKPPVRTITDRVRETTQILSKDDGALCGQRPLEDLLELLACPNCTKRIRLHEFIDHHANCRGPSPPSDQENGDTLGRLSDTDPPLIGLLGNGSTNSDSSASAATSAAMAAANKRKRQDRGDDRPVDLDAMCGVLTNEATGHVCMRSLACKAHSNKLKKIVPGRSDTYEHLLSLHQSRQAQKKLDDTKQKKHKKQMQLEGIRVSGANSPLSKARKNSLGPSVSGTMFVDKGRSGGGALPMLKIKLGGAKKRVEVVSALGADSIEAVAAAYGHMPVVVPPKDKKKRRTKRSKSPNSRIPFVSNAGPTPLGVSSYGAWKMDTGPGYAWSSKERLVRSMLAYMGERNPASGSGAASGGDLHEPEPNFLAPAIPALAITFNASTAKSRQSTNDGCIDLFLPPVGPCHEPGDLPNGLKYSPACSGTAKAATSFSYESTPTLSDTALSTELWDDNHVLSLESVAEQGTSAFGKVSDVVKLVVQETVYVGPSGPLAEARRYSAAAAAAAAEEDRTPSPVSPTAIVIPAAKPKPKPRVRKPKGKAEKKTAQRAAATVAGSAVVTAAPTAASKKADAKRKAAELKAANAASKAAAASDPNLTKKGQPRKRRKSAAVAALAAAAPSSQQSASMQPGHVAVQSGMTTAAGQPTQPQYAQQQQQQAYPQQAQTHPTMVAQGQYQQQTQYQQQGQYQQGHQRHQVTTQGQYQATQQSVASTTAQYHQAAVQQQQMSYPTQQQATSHAVQHQAVAASAATAQQYQQVSQPYTTVAATAAHQPSIGATGSVQPNVATSTAYYSAQARTPAMAQAQYQQQALAQHQHHHQHQQLQQQQQQQQVLVQQQQQALVQQQTALAQQQQQQQQQALAQQQRTAAYSQAVNSAAQGVQMMQTTVGVRPQTTGGQTAYAVPATAAYAVPTSVASVAGQMQAAYSATPATAATNGAQQNGMYTALQMQQQANPNYAAQHAALVHHHQQQRSK